MQGWGWEYGELQWLPCLIAVGPALLPAPWQGISVLACKQLGTHDTQEDAYTVGVLI